MPGRRRRGERLDPRVTGEVGRGFLRFRQAQFAGGDDFDLVRPQKVRQFVQFALVVAGQNQLVAGFEFAAHQSPTALRCASNNAVVPVRASRSKLENSSSENEFFSAVAWISTSPPASVNTKLASASAEESSS